MEHHWSEIRDRAADALGDAPTGQLEQDIIDVFLDDPERVIRTIDRIVKTHPKKPFGSPWAVIRADVTKVGAGDAVASPTKSRQAMIDRGKTWIRNAGCHHPTWNECTAELFGDAGMTPPIEYLEQLEASTRDNPGRDIYEGLLLTAIARTNEHGPEPIPVDTSAPLYTLRDDQTARDELHAEWLEHRQYAEVSDQDHEDWNAKCKRDREIMLSIKAQQQAEAKARFALPNRISDEEYFEGKTILAQRSKPTSEDIDFT